MSPAETARLSDLVELTATAIPSFGAYVASAAVSSNIVIAGFSWFSMQGPRIVNILSKVNPQTIVHSLKLMHRARNVIPTLQQARSAFSGSNATLNRAIHGKNTNITNTDWHHIVQQHSTNMARFGKEAINSLVNKVPMDRALHDVTRRVQSSNCKYGITFSKEIAKKSWEEQVRIGRTIYNAALDGFSKEDIIAKLNLIL